MYRLHPAEIIDGATHQCMPVRKDASYQEEVFAFHLPCKMRCLPCRKRCERDGKYLEARAASVRLAELKTQEAQRMRQAIMERQVLH